MPLCNGAKREDPGTGANIALFPASQQHNRSVLTGGHWRCL